MWQAASGLGKLIRVSPSSMMARVNFQFLHIPASFQLLQIHNGSHHAHYTRIFRPTKPVVSNSLHTVGDMP